MKYQENKFFVVVKFLKCAENVPKPSNYPAPFQESLYATLAVRLK
jgi:hypothetical protein